MVIIAVTNIPTKMNLKEVVKALASTIRGHFEALNFTHSKHCKTVYLRLAEQLNPNEVITRLNQKKLKLTFLRAFIPDVVPNLPLSQKPRTIPTKIRRALHLPANLSQDQLVSKSMESIVREMQTKFTGLHKLSITTGHTLLDNIGQAVHGRLASIVQDNNEEDNCFKLTKAYRKRHPHFGDFQFIMDTLHAIQDKQGKPRSEIDVKKLTGVAYAGFTDLPYSVMKPICDDHIAKISKKLVEHVNNLELTNKVSSPEEAAQMKVRKHLKNMTPYLSTFVRQVITDHFMPDEERFFVVKVYGEPFLPTKEVLMQFTKHHCAVSTIRSENMYNLISLKVPAATHMDLLKADGSFVGGAKLVVRNAHMPMYKVTRVLSVAKAIENRLPEPRESPESTDEQDPKEMEWSDEW